MIGLECGQLNGSFASDNSRTKFIISLESNESPAFTADLQASVINASSSAFGNSTSSCGCSGSLSSRSVIVCAAVRVGRGAGIARISIVFAPNSSHSKPTLLKSSAWTFSVDICCGVTSTVTGSNKPCTGIPSAFS